MTVAEDLLLMLWRVALPPRFDDGHSSPDICFEAKITSIEQIGIPGHDQGQVNSLLHFDNVCGRVGC